MTTMNQILVESVHSNKSNNMVWAVYVQGNEQDKCYCKSPYKAMRMAFYLKKQTGAYIEDTSLALLSLVIRESKASNQEPAEVQEQINDAAEQFVEEHSVDNVLAKDDEGIEFIIEEKPKKQRKAASKREASELASMSECKQSRTKSKSRTKKEKVAA